MSLLLFGRMKFLPVVERELRVAARKRSTFWLRLVAALTGLIIGSGFLVLSEFVFGLGTVNLGKGLFAVLTWLSLAAGLSAGLFFTSDCLSEEKREGTLGFLFLTDLRAYDIVLGKFSATSLRGFYAFLAVLPILAITLMMGGVTGEQFWKTSLALINALFISLAAGLLASALSRDSQKALGATILLLLVLVGFGPATDGVVSTIKNSSFNPLLSFASPGYLFVDASAAAGRHFWPGLLVNQLIGWLLLGLTCALLPRTWQDKAGKGPQRGQAWVQRWKFGGLKARFRRRRKFLEINPILWLVCRERWQALSLWLVTVLFIGVVAAIYKCEDRSLWWIAWNYLGSGVRLVLYLGIASQAGRFFVEAQRSGLTELLLATPLTPKQIVSGHWRALLQMFGPPLLLFFLAQCLGIFSSHQMTWRQSASVPPTPPVSTTNVSSNSSISITTTTTVTTYTAVGSTAVAIGGSSVPYNWVLLAASVLDTVTIAANLAALVWFGMWMGVTSRSANFASLKTILFIQVIPWFVVSFVSAMAVPLFLMRTYFRNSGTAAQSPVRWIPLIFSGVGAVLYLAKDFGFCLWARKKLYSDFRERVVLANQPGRTDLQRG